MSFFFFLSLYKTSPSRLNAYWTKCWNMSKILLEYVTPELHKWGSRLRRAHLASDFKGIDTPVPLLFPLISISHAVERQTMCPVMTPINPNTPSSPHACQAGLHLWFVKNGLGNDHFSCRASLFNDQLQLKCPSTYPSTSAWGAWGPDGNWTDSCMPPTENNQPTVWCYKSSARRNGNSPTTLFWIWRQIIAD